MSCSRIDDAGAYALHALDADEAREYVGHMESCHACQDAVADLANVVDTLPMAAPQLGPPPELKARIMAVVQSEADLFEAAASARADRPEADAVSRWAWLRLPRLAPLAAAGMACTVLAVGVGMGTVLSADEDRPAATQTFAAAEAPAGADVTVQVAEDGSGELVAASLPAPPEDKVWQVWLMDARGEVRPTHALFTVPQDGRVRVSIDGPVGDARRVMVTAEPPGGSERPTSPVVVAADIA